MLSAFCYLKYPISLYFEVILTHLPILRKIWGTGLLPTWDTSISLCGLSTILWTQHSELGMDCGLITKRNLKTTLRKLLPEKRL